MENPQENDKAQEAQLEGGDKGKETQYDKNDMSNRAHDEERDRLISRHYLSLQ